ncbi:2-acyl-glycerophospho-ethanolamine acyltransferase [Holospora obtusa F1]|uniref:2-acyl-glycerophospho-ethanolamine acyltransferase n=1 Tax=Holospora obtusa F1 TaxID=1399147 RepID=W6TFB3_HOLOB|nr:lysophospholipid acyltransferase family protein [Holospora obtusa]ETZ06685.1 2-acyl-glycerophospho-ethanolamine acyltransferase [Holospora obtusa F1]
MDRKNLLTRFYLKGYRILAHLCFYSENFFITLLGGLALPFLYLGPVSWSHRVAQWWCRCLLASATRYLGITWKVKNLPSKNDHPKLLIACAHQSVWETLILTIIFKTPSFVLKNTLMRVPILGWFFRRLHMIPIERGKMISKNFLKKAQKSLDEERSIVIFPEGKRVPFGKTARCHQGVFFLYKTFNLPVLVLSLNSGFFWPPRRFFKNSGCIEMQGHPLIEVGLDKETFHKKLCTCIQQGNACLAQNIQIK